MTANICAVLGGADDPVAAPSLKSCFAIGPNGDGVSLEGLLYRLYACALDFAILRGKGDHAAEQ